MSANDGATMQRKPHSISAQGACSREEPQPKFLRARRIVAPLERGWFSTNSGALRQAPNSASEKPVRLIDFRCSLAMIWSVSTLARSSGATRPLRTVNFSIASAPAPDVDEVSRDGGRGRHRRADEVRAPAFALPAFEVAVRGRGTALAAPEAVGVHAKAHRAARLAPFEAGVAEYAVEPFPLGLGLHHSRARHHQGQLHVGGDAPALHHRGRRAQVLDARVGARADEYLVELDVGDAGARLE